MSWPDIPPISLKLINWVINYDEDGFRIISNYYSVEKWMNGEVTRSLRGRMAENRG
jgi:hypothetical protein